MTHTIVVRLDGLGDVLVSGPAVRAVAAASSRVTMLAGPAGAAAAHLLPGVDQVLTWSCPWILADPPQVTRSDTSAIVDQLGNLGADRALILTSFHQSALPTAMLLRLAGIPEISAVSEDYPGRLLDRRLPTPDPAPEPVRMLAIAAAAGYPLTAGDDGRLAVRAELTPALRARPDVLAVHPGVSAPARAYPLELWKQVVRDLTDNGWTVVVTGSAAERTLTAEVASAAVDPATVIDRGGQDDLASLTSVLRSARVVVAANTGPAHLAAAVGTPVVSLFAPVVDERLWAPHGVPTIVLGDRDAPCRGTRSRICPVRGHPCLSSVAAESVVAAVDALAHCRSAVPA